MMWIIAIYSDCMLISRQCYKSLFYNARFSIIAYFLTAQSYKRIRLITGVYGMYDVREVGNQLSCI